MLWEVEVEPVVHHVLSVLARHGGRLAAITVEGPGELHQEIEVALRAMLRERGHEPDEIHQIAGAFPLRLLSVEVVR